MKMEIREVKLNDINDELAEMVALFRVELRSYKGITSTPNIAAGKEEIEEYLLAKFPVFVALVDENYAGYMVCRIQDAIVWVESIYVTDAWVLRLLCMKRLKNLLKCMAMRLSIIIFILIIIV